MRPFRAPAASYADAAAGGEGIGEGGAPKLKEAEGVTLAERELVDVEEMVCVLEGVLDGDGDGNRTTKAAISVGLSARS